MNIDESMRKITYPIFPHCISRLRFKTAKNNMSDNSRRKVMAHIKICHKETRIRISLRFFTMNFSVSHFRNCHLRCNKVNGISSSPSNTYYLVSYLQQFSLEIISPAAAFTRKIIAALRLRPS